MSFRNRTIFSVQSLDDVSVQQIPNPGRNAVSRLEIMLADIGTDIITNGRPQRIGRFLRSTQRGKKCQLYA